jgi:hypothetical protein
MRPTSTHATEVSAASAHPAKVGATATDMTATKVSTASAKVSTASANVTAATAAATSATTARACGIGGARKRNRKHNHGKPFDL